MRRSSTGILAGTLAVRLVIGVPVTEAELVPDAAPELPVLSREVPAGGGTMVEAACGREAVARSVDGDVSDWIGESPRFGGVAVHSCGEYVYQDHLFDAYGADDGNDVERLAMLEPASDEPRAYRLDPTVQYAQGELGLPSFGPFTGDQKYGDASRQDDADIAEVRVAADADDVHVLVRTTSMQGDETTAVLLLADTEPVDAVYGVPFGSGLSTATADVAILLAAGVCRVADLASGTVTSSGDCVTATDSTGFTNAIEGRIPRALLESFDGKLRLAAGTGTYDGTGGLAGLGVDAALSNVAFRFEEPVRIHFEMLQALALHGGTIDRFFTEIDLARLESGATERYVPGPGYHDRIFLSDPALSAEAFQTGQGQGIYQHYGVYLPAAYDAAAPEPTPLQVWMHFRGGLAHTVAAVVPRVFQDYGEDVGTIVVSPSGRGTSRWYVGRGHVDFLEMWDDVHATFAIDPDRVYASGHSMGGWGTYLMTVLYPDRFAAGMPVAGPVTQGAWTGADLPGCDDLQYDEYSPCYIEANGSRPRDQHTRRMLENLRNTPLAIFQGAIDELVPVSGVTRQVEQLHLLGYPHRYYLFPNYEHYSHPAVDEWEEGVRYLHSFVRDPNPRHVVYRRDRAFEAAVEEIQSDGLPLSFDFDSAYWMSGLGIAEGAEAARFDGTSLARPGPPEPAIPEASGPAAPGQTGPYVMVGLARNDVLPPPDTTNGFEATLEGASTVTLDLGRMSIDVAEPVSGNVSTASTLALRLDGGWTSMPIVEAVPQPVSTSFAGGVLTLELAPGETALLIAQP